MLTFQKKKTLRIGITGVGNLAFVIVTVIYAFSFNYQPDLVIWYKILFVIVMVIHASFFKWSNIMRVSLLIYSTSEITYKI